MYIDKRSGRMKQVMLNGSQTGPDGKSMSMNMTMVVKREVLNQPIPNSAFVFTPPPGAREVQGDGGGSMIPGIGGLGGGN